MHHEATTQGLHDWHKHMFEHLGWVLLAKVHGNDYKVSAYKKSLVHLKKSLEEKVNKIHDEDKKEDLLILHKNVLILQGFVDKAFKN